MKVVNIMFEDGEHEIIESIKKEHGGNWHDFLLDLAKFYKENKS